MKKVENRSAGDGELVKVCEQGSDRMGSREKSMDGGRDRRASALGSVGKVLIRDKEALN